MTAAGEALVAIGADGIVGGWVTAACRVDHRVWKQATSARELPLPSARHVELQRRDDVAAIAGLRHGTEAVIALDVPLGVPEHGGTRPCDAEARRLLGKGASSVFNPPGRYLFPALEKETAAERWEEVQRLIDERRKAYPQERVVGVSRQTIGILDKVADADTYLRAHPDAETWLIECHPEISFLRLNGDTRLAPKSRAKGTLERLALIEREFPGTESNLRTDPIAESTPLTDLLDAHAALWTALRIATDTIHPTHDALGTTPTTPCPRADGLPMRIVA